LVDTLNTLGKEKICELNVTSKGVEEIVNEIIDILEKRKKCRVGIVDWIGRLEKEGLLSEFLKI